MPTTSLVDQYLDDAAMGRVQADEAVTHAQQIGVFMIRAGRRLLADCRIARAGTDEVMVALHELRRLRPSVQGRRTDLITVREEVAAS